MCAPLYYPHPLYKHNGGDVTIICFPLQVGKTLWIHGKAVSTHPCIHQHPCPVVSQSHAWTISSIPYPSFQACDTLPQVFWCTLVPEPAIYYNNVYNNIKVYTKLWLKMKVTWNEHNGQVVQKVYTITIWLKPNIIVQLYYIICKYIYNLQSVTVQLQNDFQNITSLLMG